MQNKFKVYYSTGTFSVSFPEIKEIENKENELYDFVEKVKKDTIESSILNIEERVPVLDINSLLEDQYLYSMS